MSLPSREKTFGLENCRDLLRKLEWEMEGLKAASPNDPDDLAFHAFNAAVTVWHIGDWVWNDMTQEHRDALADEWGKPLNVNGNFLSAVRQENREIGLCREIATASKHVEVSQSPDLTVDTVVSAGPATAITVATNGVPEAPSPIWALKVLDRGQRRSILEVLEGALAFWTEFIYQRGIAR